MSLIVSDFDIPDGGARAYLVLAGSFLGLVVNLGLINSIGAVEAYVLTHQLAETASVPVSMVFAIYLSLAYSMGVFVLFDKHGALWLLVALTVLIFGGLMAAASSQEVWQFCLSFVALGLGNGIGLTPLVAVINHWFLKKRGTCTGIATSGGSVGGVVFPILLRYLYGKYGFAWAMRILAFFTLGCMLCAVAFVKERVYRKDPEPEEAPASGVSLKSRFANSLGVAALRDKTFITLVAGAWCTELSMVLVVTYFPSYALAQGMSETTAYLLLTIWNCAGIFGRWLPGYALDYWGKFNVNLLMLTVFAVSIFTMWYPFGSRKGILYAFAVVGGFSSGSILTMLPACLAQITAVDQFGFKYLMINMFLAVGNLIVVPIGASIIDKRSSEDFKNYVVLVGCLAVTGTLFWFLARYRLVGNRLKVKV